MAKNFNQEKEKRKTFWDDFTNLQMGEWTIKYNPKTKRVTLRKNGEFKISDVALYSLKRMAADYYGLTGEWKKMQ